MKWLPDEQAVCRPRNADAALQGDNQWLWRGVRNCRPGGAPHGKCKACSSGRVSFLLPQVTSTLLHESKASKHAAPRRRRRRRPPAAPGAGSGPRQRPPAAPGGPSGRDQQVCAAQVSGSPRLKPRQVQLALASGPHSSRCSTKSRPAATTMWVSGAGCRPRRTAHRRRPHPSSVRKHWTWFAPLKLAPASPSTAHLPCALLMLLQGLRPACATASPSSQTCSPLWQVQPTCCGPPAPCIAVLMLPGAVGTH